MLPRAALGGLLAALLLAGCGARAAAPPGPGSERGVIPDLGGQRVLVLPLQLRTGGHADFDAELAYALRESAGRVDWVEPTRIREVLERSPGTGIRIDGMPVRIFLAGEVQRVGDPIFGDLYRLGALVGAGWALLPVESRSRVDAAGETVEVSAALLDTRTGRVAWFGVVEGGVGAAGSLAPTATAAETLARRVAR